MSLSSRLTRVEPKRASYISARYDGWCAAEQRELYDERLASSDSVASSPVVNGRPGLDQTPSTEFKLRDPRTVFHDFFGGKDPFSEVFGIPGNYYDIETAQRMQL